MPSKLKVAVLSLVIVCGATPALAQFDDIWRVGARVHAVASDHNSLWAVGGIVSVRGSVKNDISAAGAEVDVDATSGRSTWAAGAIVTVSGQSQNMYVAAARANIDARLRGKLSVAA